MTALSLSVKNLSVSIAGKLLLDDVSFEVAAGEKIGFIGGSGSGKTLTALAITGLLPENASVSGSILLDGRELLGLSDSKLAAVRGDQIGMVFQEPKSALNPLRKLGSQMTEALAAHYSLTRAERREAALKVAERVGLDNPQRIASAYPNEVSGGQRQRAAIAAAIVAGPGLLLADEPTTALDVTVQKGIIKLFKQLTSDSGASLIFITHDLAVMASIAERIYVFENGKIVESGLVEEIILRPQSTTAKELILASESEATGELLSRSLVPVTSFITLPKNPSAGDNDER